MSQVRKYQTGGTAVNPEEKKKEEKTAEELIKETKVDPNVSNIPKEAIKPLVPGLEEITLKETAKPSTEETLKKHTSYIVLDGEKFENTEENRQKIARYFAQVADPHGGSQILNQIKDLMFEASQNGYTINYDTPGNEFSYIDPQGQSHFIDWRHLNNRQDKRLQKERSWLGRFFDSAFNTDVQKSAEDIYKMRGLAAYLRGDTGSTTAVVDPNLINIGYGSGFFQYLKDPETKDYLKDENGNLKYDKNSAENQKAMQILNRTKRYLGLTTDEERKQFHLDDAWNKEGAWDALKGIYDSNPEAFAANYDNIINKIVTGQKLSAEDISWLKLFGFNPDNVKKTPEEEAAEAANLAKTKWTNAGYGDLYDKGKDWFNLGDDNLLTITDVGKAVLNDYLLDSPGNEFNKEWFKWLTADGRNANVSDYGWLDGYTLYNGKLYKTDSAQDPNSALGKIYITSGFVDKNRNNQYGEAQKIINTFWGNPYEWSSPDESYYSNFTWDQDANNGKGGYRTGRRYRSENGRYTGLKPGQQLVSYYDEDAERDYRGFVTDNGIRYAITDENGDVVLDGLTKEDLKKYATIITDSAGNEVAYSSDPNIPFNQIPLYKSSDYRVNNHTGIFFGQDDEYALYYNPMYSMPDPKNSESWTLYTDNQLDAAYVVPSWIAYYLKKKDSNGVSGMQKLLANPDMQNKLRNILKRLGDYSSSWTSDLTRAGGDANIEKLGRFLGMTEKEIEATKQEWDSMMEADKLERKSKFKVDKNSFPKKKQNNATSYRQGGTIRKFAPGGGFAKVSGNSGSTKQNRTKIKDSRESRHIGDNEAWTSADKADLVGLIADIGAIALGSMPVAGGFAGLAGTGAGLYADIKRDGFQWSDLGTAGFSAAADIVSMIPGLGSGTQAAKVAAKIATKSRVLIKGLSYIGAVNAIPVVHKIMNGEKPTIQEWRVLANGIAAGVNVAKLGGPGSKTKKGTFKDIDVKGKGEHEVDAFNLKPNAGEDLPEINLTKEQIAEINAITDPVLKKQKIARYIATELQKDPRTAGKPIKDLVEKYNYDSYAQSVSSPSEGITVKSRVKGEPDIVLTKADVDEINAQPDAAAKMAKAKEKIAYYRGIGNPSATDAMNKAAAEKYNLNKLWTVKSNLALNGKIKVNRSDITLNDTDIKAISTKATPAEQEKAFVDIVKSKSGDDSLDSIDKIKEAFKVDDFFEKKRGSWSWNPITTVKNKLKKTDTFTLKAEQVEEPKPVRGNGKEGLFGFRDWWNNVGTYRGTNRSDLFNNKSVPTFTPITPTTSPTSGTSSVVKTAPNWWPGFMKAIYTPKNQRGILVMQPGNNPWLRIHNYTAEEAPGVIEDENDNTYGMTGAYTYKKGGLIPKAKNGGSNIISGGLTMPQTWKEKLANSALSSLPTIGEFASMATAIKANNKVRDTLNEALKNPPMMIAPHYNTPRFNDNGVLNEGRQLVKNIYDRQPANYTSDAMLNNFVRKANQEKATEYENKINNAFSQQLAQHWAKMQEIQNKNLENQINTTNQNHQTIYANQNAIAKNNAATIISNWQSVDNFAKDRIKNLTQQLNNARALKAQFSDAKTKSILANSQGYKDASENYHKYLKANPTGVGFDEWLQTLGSTYKDAYLGALGTAQLSSGRDQIAAANLGIFGNDVDNYLNSIWGTNIPSSKSGGKISKSNSSYRGYRDYKEQIAIDAHKEVRKAIAQLNKDCQQLLLKMLK